MWLCDLQGVDNYCPNFSLDACSNTQFKISLKCAVFKNQFGKLVKSEVKLCLKSNQNITKPCNGDFLFI